MHRVHSAHGRPILRQTKISTRKSKDQLLFLLVYLVSGLFGGLISNKCTDNGSVAGREFVICCIVNFYAYLFLYGESGFVRFFVLNYNLVSFNRCIVVTKSPIQLPGHYRP